MNDQHCRNCHYFLQHFTLDNQKIFRVCCGHCTFSRVRRKSPDSKACGNYVPGLPQEHAFVTKEYLSKELLKYVLNLNLLPEIEESSHQR